MEKRHRLLAAAATVVVVAVLLPSVGGVTQIRSGPAASLTPFAVSGASGVTIPVGEGPWGVAFNPVNSLVYVSNFGSGTVSAINTTSDRVVTSIPVPVLNGYGNGPIAVNTATGIVYVGDGVGTVYGINASSNKVALTISLASYGCPNGCGADVQTYDTTNGDIYVTNIVTNNVTVIHGVSVVATVPVGVAPNGAAYDSGNGEIFVSNEGSSANSNLTVIDGTTNNVVGQVYPVNTGPGVAYDAMNGNLYVCSNNVQVAASNFVTVVNGTDNGVVSRIPTEGACGASIYDPVNGYVFVTERLKPGGSDDANVSVIDPTSDKVVLNLPVLAGPIGLAFDPENRNIYVADSDANLVSILPQIYRLTVHETGLPTGTNWSATVGGTTFSSTTPTITFPETNGTYSFTIGHLTNRSACPSSGNVTVAGGSTDLNVTFSSSTCGGGSSRGLFGLPGTTGYYVLAGIGAVAAILVAVVVVLSRRRKRDAVTSPPPTPSGPPPLDNRLR